LISTEEKIAKHYLYPSNLFSSASAHLVTTVLGSCVSVCLVDEKRKIGGINHFMLPLWNGQGLASVKYGNIAMDKLINEMEQLGSNRKDIVAKIFGGANQANFTIKIGERNLELAKTMLEHARIKIVAESTGGQMGRKIIFNTYTGTVRMKIVSSEIRQKIT
jgi:chemotaxis protein CheD